MPFESAAQPSTAWEQFAQVTDAVQEQTLEYFQ